MSTNADLVKENFKDVSPRASHMAERFYSTLFKRAPELLPLFDHTDWAKQRYILVASLYYIVFNLDNPQALKRSLGEMGARHMEYGIEPQDFIVFGECLLDAIAYVSGPTWNDTLHQAWTEAYNEVREMMLAKQTRPAASNRPK